MASTAGPPVAGSLSRAFRRDLAAAPADPGPVPAVTAERVATLPPAVQRYLSAMGAVGRPPVRSFTVAFQGRFRRGADDPWMPCQAWQYNVASPLTRIYTIRVLLARVVPMIGHDSYVNGRGRLLGRVAGLFTVAEGSGEPFDIGELTTFLNDAVLLAPSMLVATASWTGVADDAFDVSLTDHGRTVTARVLLDDRGLPVDFRTTDRFYDSPAGPVRCEWRTPISRWDLSGERPFPGPGRATWMLPDADPLTYVEGQFLRGTVRTDVTPRRSAP